MQKWKFLTLPGLELQPFMYLPFIDRPLSLCEACVFLWLLGKLKLRFRFKLYYDRWSVGQFVLVSGSYFNFRCLTITFFLLHVGLPLWGVGGSVIFSAITHCLESRRTNNHILLSHLRLSQPGEPGPRIYIPQEHGGPVIPPGTGFPFRRFLRLAGPRQRYSNSLPHGAAW
jgi:hypothetical protein